MRWITYWKREKVPIVQESRVCQLGMECPIVHEHVVCFMGAPRALTRSRLWTLSTCGFTLPYMRRTRVLLAWTRHDDDDDDDDERFRAQQRNPPKRTYELALDFKHRYNDPSRTSSATTHTPLTPVVASSSSYYSSSSFSFSWFHNYTIIYL